MAAALLLGALVGLVLGLLGGGGSLIAVPLLAHGLGLPAREAVATALGAVGLAALAAAAVHARARAVDLRAALVFGLLGALGSLLGAQAARSISGATQLLLFAAVTLVAGALMLRPRRAPTAPAAPGAKSATGAAPAARPVWVLLPAGLGTGLLTGLLGVGGGFIIVPALTLVVGLPMRRAVGTSLLVLGLTALAGFASYATWVPLGGGPTLLFAGAALLTGPAAALVADRVPQARLRQAFGALLLLVSLAALAQGLTGETSSGP